MKFRTYSKTLNEHLTKEPGLKFLNFMFKVVLLAYFSINAMQFKSEIKRAIRLFPVHVLFVVLFVFIYTKLTTTTN